MAYNTEKDTTNQKQFIAKIFIDCYAIFIKVDNIESDSIRQFQTNIENDGQSLYLDLTSSILMYFFVYDKERCEEIRNAYENNLDPLPTELANYKSLADSFFNHYLMTQFFLSEGLIPHENYTLGYRQIKKAGNEDLYYKFYHYTLYELQQLIFNPNKVDEIKNKAKSYIPFQAHANILNPIKNMDFDLFLNTFPDIAISPPNITKAFARKLNEIFTLFKSEGDTVLNIKNCTPPPCNCGNCTHNPYKYIYAFIGNVSKNYFALTMYITKNDEPRVVSISNLYEYNIDIKNTTNDTTNETSLSKAHTFKIYDDETDSFYPTDEYLDMISNCIRAFDSLKSQNNTISTLAELENWLLTYKLQKDFTKCNYKVLREFYPLYNELSSLLIRSKYIDYAKKAMLDFNAINENKSADLLAWLMKHESFYNEYLAEIKENYLGVSDDYFDLSILDNYQIAISILDYFSAFLNAYESNYNTQLDLLKNTYLSQHNITIEEFEKDNSYIENELSYFYNLVK